MESAPDITARLDRIESALGTLARDYKRDSKTTQQHRKRSTRKLEQVTEAAAWSALTTDLIFYGVCLGAVAIVDVYALIMDNVPGWAKSYFQFTRTAAEQPYHQPRRAPSAHTITSMPVGSTIAGYRVTSGYGPRRSPCPGCSSNHPGIDVGTPTGTPLYAPGGVSVQCKIGEGAGNYAEFDYQGMTHQWLHLATCTAGAKSFGEQFATTGATGAGTGPHLDYRVKQDGQRVYPPKEVLTAALDPSAFKQAPPPSSAAPSDETLKRAIGRAEGTRNPDGTPNRAWHGHTDPGNRKHNLGSFSYQHGASSPDEADQKWLAVLRKAEPEIQAQAVAKFGQPLSKAALVAALDAYTQSPDAGKRFVPHLATADPTPQQLVDARAAALAESRRVYPGGPMNVTADQQRRVNRLLEQL